MRWECGGICLAQQRKDNRPVTTLTSIESANEYVMVSKKPDCEQTLGKCRRQNGVGVVISLPRSSISSEKVLFRVQVMKKKREKFTILKEVFIIFVCKYGCYNIYFVHA